MKQRNATQLDDLFSALSDPTRRAIIDRLAVGEISVSELAFPFRMSLPAISKHLRVLETAGLISRRKEGRTHYCRLNVGALRTATEWLDRYRQFWEGQFDALARFLQTQQEANGEKP